MIILYKNKFMSKLYPSSKIYISKSKIKNAGIGVFASKDIEKREIIETVPIIETSDSDVSYVYQLVDYVFRFGEKPVVALGYGSIYNHSYEPNATYKKILKNKVITFVAIKPIKKGEEITVNYNGDPDDKTPVQQRGVPLYKEQ